MPFFQRKRSKQIIFLSLILFHLLLISIQVPLGFEKNFFEKTVFSLFSPIQHGFSFLFRQIGNLWNNYFYLSKVQKQNKKLEKEIFSLRQENNLLRRALQKLKDRRNIEDFISNVQSSFLVAQVIGIDASNAYKSISIDKGSLDGIKKNMVILDRKGSLVGRVIDPISLKEARVQLITDNESGVGVISEKTKVKGVLKGDAKGRCFLKYIYATQDVSVGEELLTSGLDRIYPSGIKVGTIVSVTTADPLFKTIQVKPSLEFSDLEMVVVIISDSDEVL